MLRFIDSFDHYSTAHLSQKYNSSFGTVSIASGQGRNSTNAFSTLQANATITKTLDNQATWVAGGAFRWAQLVASGVIIEFVDNATAQVGVYLNNDGTLSVKRNGNLGTTLATSSNSIFIANWFYIELKATVNNSGTYEVRVNGVIWISGSGDTQQSANAYANRVSFGGAGSLGTGGYTDDIYVCDTTGSVNNNFLGDIRVEAVFPAANGTTIQWTVSGVALNYQAIDEVTPNDETDFNFTTTSGFIDLFDFTNLTSISGIVYGLQTDIYVRKDDAGSRYLRRVIRRGGTNYEGSVVTSVLDNYSYSVEIAETDPSTLVLWTITNINGAEFGYKSEG